MISLLGNLGLRSRLLFEGEDFPDKKDISVDFSKANLELQKEREKSFTFLTKAMEG